MIVFVGTAVFPVDFKLVSMVEVVGTAVFGEKCHF